MDYKDPVQLQLVWSRLIAVADDAARAIGRTAFSTIVRESKDYVTVVLDSAGRTIAQSSRAIPSFIGSAPRAAQGILRDLPVAGLRPGDVLMTNDPFLGNGHLPDIVMLTPVFLDGRVVAHAACIAHVPDIGGRPLSPDASDMVEEGIRMPPVHYRHEGAPNTDLLRVLHASVRTPDEVLGDMESMAGANERAAEGIRSAIVEHDLGDLDRFGRVLHRRAEAAMRAAIGRLPVGSYQSEITLDGFNEPISLRATVRLLRSRIHVDYEAPPQSRQGINVVPNYRFAHTAYALKCLLDPDTPNNDGSFRVITDAAPAGTLLNPARNAACNARNLVGHALPSLIFSAMAPVVPDRVQADSGGAPMWSINCVGSNPDGSSFAALQFFHGGQGGRSSGDGNPTFSFPSNCKVTPVEIYERRVPVLIECKDLIPDSGGAGRYRGGLAQRARIRNISSADLTLYINTEHIVHPPAGILGGEAGRAGAVRVDGEPVPAKGRLVLGPGATLELETPGGGGWGDAAVGATDPTADPLVVH